MPYSVPRNPAPLDKSKNFPGIDTSEITMHRRIITVGSFVSNNNILNTQKSVQKAYQAIRSTNQGNIFQQTALTRSLLADETSAPSSPTNLVTSFTNITSTNCDCTVSWSVPSSDGRSPIIEYGITGSPGNLSGTTDVSIRTFTFTGLSVDTLYTFTVTATNIIGTSVAATVTVTTPTAPSSPTNLVTSIDTNSSTYINCTVSWNIPSSNGGAAITGYTITGSPGNLSGSTNASTRTFTFSGLSSDTLYTFTVTATNIIGTSVAATVTVTTPVVLDSTSYTSNGSIVFITQTSLIESKRWTAKFGSSSNGVIDVGGPPTSDSNGNLTLAGYFLNAPTFVAYNKNDTLFERNLVSYGLYDTFILQYSSTGSVNWIAQIGGTGNEISYFSHNVSSDSSGNINIVGYFFSTTLKLYDKNGTQFATTLVNPGNLEIFVAQYSSTGFVNWVARIGGSLNEYPSSITTDSSGNITVIGYFSSPTLTAYNEDGTSFGTTLALAIVGQNSNFRATYNSAGYVTAFIRT